MNSITKNSFESKAKLMITGEYLVLNGALSLAIPLKFGQRITITESEGVPSVRWKSLINNDFWFSAKFILPDFTISNTNQTDVAETLRKILVTAQDLNSGFLNKYQKYQVLSEMDFVPEWGIGSSSSLISNIAYWANCNAFDLNKLIFNGSGYDIACSRSSNPIIYKIVGNTPSYQKSNFNPPFYKHLFFVYLNRKQSSKESIQKSDLSHVTIKTIDTISEITREIEKSDNLEAFQKHLERHEALTGKILRKIPVKTQHFNDFNGSVKSLGAWGGDFIMVASSAPEEYVRNYFSDKELNIIFRYDDIVINEDPKT